MGQVVPLVLLNWEHFRFPFLFPSIPLPIDQMRQVGFPQDLLPAIDTDIPIHAIVVSRPRPSSAVENIIRSYVAVKYPVICGRTGEIGTAGVSVWDRAEEKYCLLTAGHVFKKGNGTPVHVLRERFLLPARTETLGTVTHHIMPNGPVAEWDAAVISTSEEVSLRSPRIRRLLRRFSRPEPVIAHGAISRSVYRAAVHQGALEEVGNEEMMWTHCWMIGKGGILTGGDSGAPVFIRRDGAFLGVFVGTSYFTDTHEPFVHYVQDAGSMERLLLDGWGVRFRREMR